MKLLHSQWTASIVTVAIFESHSPATKGQHFWRGFEPDGVWGEVFVTKGHQSGFGYWCSRRIFSIYPLCHAGRCHGFKKPPISMLSRLHTSLLQQSCCPACWDFIIVLEVQNLVQHHPCKMWSGIFKVINLPETNIALENWWLVQMFHFLSKVRPGFQLRTVS